MDDYDRGRAAAREEIAADGWTRETARRFLAEIGALDSDPASESEYGRGFNKILRALARGESHAEKVARARAHADAGEHDAAAGLLYDLAVADREGDIGYAERMRWHETVGVLERAGFDLRAVFQAREVPQ